MNVVWEVAICDLTKKNEQERKRLLERFVPSSAKDAEQDCRAMIKYYDMIIEHEYWRLLADTPEQYFLTYFKKPIYWLEQVKQVLLSLDNPDPRSQSRAGSEARLATLKKQSIQIKSDLPVNILDDYKNGIRKPESCLVNFFGRVRIGLYAGSVWDAMERALDVFAAADPDKEWGRIQWGNHSFEAIEVKDKWEFLEKYITPIIEQGRPLIKQYDKITQHNQAKTRIEARLAELQQELSTINGEAYRGCWLDTSEVNGRLYKRLRWFRPDGKKGCRILKGEELCQAVKAIELLTQVDETTKQLDRVVAILTKLEALDQEKAALLAEIAAI